MKRSIDHFKIYVFGLINRTFFLKKGHMWLATALIVFSGLTACQQQIDQAESEETNTVQISENTDKPNVVLINVDDLGYGDVGCYGATKVKTPNIDKLAQQGRKFTDAHSASAVCSPSRYGLITGQYPSRINFWHAIFMRSPLVVDTAQMTIARVMKKAGYATGIVGKWHLGFGNTEPVDWNSELKPGPLELGFDYYFGVPVLNSHPPFVYVENHRIVGLTEDDPMEYDMHAETRYFPEKFGMEGIGGGRAAHALFDDRGVGTTLKNKAIEYIKEHRNEPFFLYYATTNIHHPFTPAPRFINSSQAGRYGDFIQELDWIVGEVMATLEEEGLAENTLLILTSDNGGMLNQGGQAAWKAGHHQNGELLGFKFDAWEGGHRVPFITRWPGQIPAGTTSDELISQVDLLATLAALVKHPLNENEGPDSYNMLAALTDTSEQPIRDQLIISPDQPGNLTIRQGKWVYISGQDGGGFPGTVIGEHDLGGAAAFKLTHRTNSDIENGKVKPHAPPAQLYNLAADLKETKNLYSKQPAKVKEMKNLLESTLQAQHSNRPDILIR